MQNAPFPTYRKNLLRLARAGQFPLAHCLIRGLGRRGFSREQLLPLFIEMHFEVKDYRLKAYPEEARALGYSHCESTRSFDSADHHAYWEKVSLQYFAQWSSEPIWTAAYEEWVPRPRLGTLGDEPMDMM